MDAIDGLANPPASVLEPATIGRLRRLRLQQRRRVDGRYAGAHRARGFGASLDFADYREYVAGDDPRRVDVHAHARLGKRLIKLYEAEDEAALRVVVDLSGSMGFGGKAVAARQAAAVLGVVAAIGGDRVRLVLAGNDIDVGPWFRGAVSVPWLQRRLGEAETGGPSDLVGATARAVREGPSGPAVLVSDLLDESWPDVLDVLSANRGDSVLVHLVGRADLDPDVEGDVRLVDVERGDEREVGIGPATLSEYAVARDRWLADIAGACNRGGIVRVHAVDDEPLPDVLIERLVAAGVLA